MSVNYRMGMGQAFDLLTILELKKKRVKSELLRESADIQHDILWRDILEAIGNPDRTDGLRYKWDELYQANQALWDLENEVRVIMGGLDESTQVADVARQIVKWNDQRFRLKQKIDKLCGEDSTEVKELPDYD